MFEANYGVRVTPGVVLQAGLQYLVNPDDILWPTTKFAPRDALVVGLKLVINANEILVSLMLVYVAEQVLNWLVYGPWKDPAGYNFPQTITFLKSTQVPKLFAGYRVNVGVVVAAVAVAAFWVVGFGVGRWRMTTVR